MPISRTNLIQDALALYSLTQDPLLMDSVRVLASPTTDEITEFATQNVLSCKQAYLTLFSNSGTHPLDGKLTTPDL